MVVLETFAGISAADTAVLVIDVQNDFCHPKGAIGPQPGWDMDYDKIISTIGQTLDRLREKSVDVIFVRTVHSGWTNSPGWAARKSNTKGPAVCQPDSWGAEFCGVSPKTGDLVITKNRYSAFQGTNLDLVLRSTGKKNLLCMGFLANVCVETAARDAFQLNYRVIALPDCIGAANDAEFEAAMVNIDKYFGEVYTLDNLWQTIREGR